MEHMESLARYRLGRGDAPNMPDWVAQRQEEVGTAGLLAHADFSNVGGGKGGGRGAGVGGGGSGGGAGHPPQDDGEEYEIS